MAGFFSSLFQRIRSVFTRLFAGKKAALDPWASPDWENRNVLVGTLRRKSQLNVALACKFYHIPAVELKNVDTPIEYVAIYQSRRMFGNAAGVRYYGRVKSAKLVRRCDIPEIYSEKTDLYYRFEIKAWKKLPRALAAKEKGFVSILTSLELLRGSREVPQLWTQSPQEFRLYDALLDALESPLVEKDPEKLTFSFEGCRVEFGEGQILITRRGRSLGQYEIAEFQALPYTVLQRMLRDIMME